MGLFGIIGNIVKIPSSIVKDVCGIENKTGETNIEKNAREIAEEL